MSRRLGAHPLETLSVFKVLLSVSQVNQVRASPSGFLDLAVNTSVCQPRSHPHGCVGSDRIPLLSNELEKTRSLLGS